MVIGVKAFEISESSSKGRGSKTFIWTTDLEEYSERHSPVPLELGKVTYVIKLPCPHVMWVLMRNGCKDALLPGLCLECHRRVAECLLCPLRGASRSCKSTESLQRPWLSFARSLQLDTTWECRCQQKLTMTTEDKMSCLLSQSQLVGLALSRPLKAREGVEERSHWIDWN